MAEKIEVIIGSNADGFILKEAVKSELKQMGIGTRDIGTFSADANAEYPDYAAKVASAVSKKMFSRGILVSGSGMGTCIAANRYPGVRAIVCTNVAMVETARSKLDCNILVLAADYTTPKDQLVPILKAWQNTEFLNGHHSTLIRLIDDNTRLNLVMGHLEDLDYDQVSEDRINFPFLKRAFAGLERLKNNFLPDDRRDDKSVRQSESCTASFKHENTNFDALMVEVSERGAQFVITVDNVNPRFIRDDKIEFSIKTPYGKTTVIGLVRWFDPVSNHLGVTFSKAFTDPDDPLKLLIDSMF